MDEPLLRNPVAIERSTPPGRTYQGCPNCLGEVEATVITCDLDIDHDRYECDACELDFDECDLVTVYPTDGDATVPEPVLDVAEMARRGAVLPGIADWLATRRLP